MVLVLLGPADEDSAVTVQPGVTGLGDPPAGFPVRVTSLLLDLFSAGADVGLQALSEHQLVDVRVVVATIEAQALW